MDRVHPDVGTAAGAVGKKTKPTMEMGTQEMPAMFRMGDSAVAPGGRMSSPVGTAAGQASAQGPTTFKGVPGAGTGAEPGQGPAMFNLKDLMGKQANLASLPADLRAVLPYTAGTAAGIGALNA